MVPGSNVIQMCMPMYVSSKYEYVLCILFRKDIYKGIHTSIPVYTDACP